jgi:hypothetical protein
LGAQGAAAGSAGAARRLPPLTALPLRRCRHRHRCRRRCRYRYKRRRALVGAEAGTAGAGSGPASALSSPSVSDGSFALCRCRCRCRILPSHGANVSFYASLQQRWGRCERWRCRAEQRLEAFVCQCGTPCVQVLYRSEALVSGVEIRLCYDSSWGAGTRWVRALGYVHRC